MDEQSFRDSVKHTPVETLRERLATTECFGRVYGNAAGYAQINKHSQWLADEIDRRNMRGIAFG